VIVCLRTVEVPPAERERSLAWIAEGRAVRATHGILAELVLEPSSGEGDTVVLTVWPSHEVFDAWIATPERGALTASDVHRSVAYRPITRYEVAGGYLNLAGLADQPDTYPNPGSDHQSGAATNPRWLGPPEPVETLHSRASPSLQRAGRPPLDRSHPSAAHTGRVIHSHLEDARPPTADP
jgi:heme-degrading monooxygenase HmoA